MSTINNYNSLKIIILSLTLIIIPQISYSASLQLTWNANSEGDLAGYKVYYGTSPDSLGTTINVGKVTQYELTGLSAGQIYYVTVSAYDTSNNESGKSAMVNGTTPSPTTIPTTSTTTSVAPTTSTTTSVAPTTSTTTSVAPTTSIPPSTTTSTIPAPLTGTSASLHLEWEKNSEGDLAGYKVYYGTSPGNYGSPVVVPLNNTNLICSNVTCGFELMGLAEGETYYVAVSAYDTSNNESEKSNAVNGIAEVPSTTTSVAPTTSIAPTTTTSVVPTTSIAPTTIPSAPTTIPPTPTTIPPIATTTVTPTTISTTTTTTPLPQQLTGTITINNGDLTTQSSGVTLTLSASKEGKQLGSDSQMKFSNNNKGWSNPETYTTTKRWTLSPGSSTKTVYVKFSDSSGNWMTNPAQDQIKLLGTQKKLPPVSILSTSELPPLWVKGKAIDENYDTSWSTFLILFWKNEYVTLDLGEVKLLDRVAMYATRFFDRDLFPIDFKIEISKDYDSWQEILTEKGYSIKPENSDSWDLNGLEGRYIRVYITKAKNFLFFFYLAQIAEIEAYGYDLPEQPAEAPEVTTTPVIAEQPEEGKEAKEKTKETGEVAGEIPGAVQGIPSVPGKPVISFSKKSLKGSVKK